MNENHHGCKEKKMGGKTKGVAWFEL